MTMTNRRHNVRINNSISPRRLIKDCSCPFKTGSFAIAFSQKDVTIVLSHMFDEVDLHTRILTKDGHSLLTQGSLTLAYPPFLRRVACEARAPVAQKIIRLI